MKLPKLKKKPRPDRVVFIGGSFTKAKGIIRGIDDETKARAQRRRWWNEIGIPVAILIFAFICAFWHAYSVTHPKGKIHVEKPV